jgi:hypothetical protein
MRPTPPAKTARASCVTAMVLTAALALLPGAAAGADAAFLHLVEPDVGSLVAEGIERRILSDLSGPGDPRLLSRSQAASRLLGDDNAEARIERASQRLAGVRDRLATGAVDPDLVDAADEAREALLGALLTRPELAQIREAWALRGLAAHHLGEPEAARRDFARVLESEPSFRPDPRLFPPEAREQVGRALMARTESNWRVLAGADAANVGRRLGVSYVIVAHLYDTGLAELAYRVDVFDVTSGRFVAEAEVHFPDAAAERERVARELVTLIRAHVRRTSAVAVAPAGPRPADPPVRPADPQAAGPADPPTPTAGGPFDVTPEEPQAPRERSGRGWWVAGAVVAAAAGGAAVWMGLNADSGHADLVVRPHRRDR